MAFASETPEEVRAAIANPNWRPTPGRTPHPMIVSAKVQEATRIARAHAIETVRAAEAADPSLKKTDSLALEQFIIGQTDSTRAHVLSGMWDPRSLGEALANDAAWKVAKIKVERPALAPGKGGNSLPPTALPTAQQAPVPAPVEMLPPTRWQRVVAFVRRERVMVPSEAGPVSAGVLTGCRHIYADGRRCGDNPCSVKHGPSAAPAGSSTPRVRRKPVPRRRPQSRSKR